VSYPALWGNNSAPKVIQRKYVVPAGLITCNFSDSTHIALIYDFRAALNLLDYASYFPKILLSETKKCLFFSLFSGHQCVLVPNILHKTFFCVPIIKEMHSGLGKHKGEKNMTAVLGGLSL